MKDTDPYSMMMLSLEGFRFIGGHFSQKAGDVSLTGICALLEKELLAARVFRFSGDEFAIVCKDAETCEQYRTRLIVRTRQPWLVESFDFRMQRGIGILHVEAHNRDKDEIIKGLEYAVMLAKRSEENRTCVCTTDMIERPHRNERIFELLRQCTRGNSFIVVYQPIYDVEGQVCTKAEVLLRLLPHGLGQLGPDEFIPLAKENGLTTEITYQALRKIYLFLQQLQHTATVLKSISTNFSAVTFLQQDLGNNILKIIKGYKTSVYMLQVGTTESMLSRDYHMIIAFIQHMCKQGIESLLDDSRTGYSNISNVLSLLIRTIKIDKSLLRKATVSTEGAVVLRRMYEAFHEVHQLLLVEGVENEEQIAFVRDCARRYTQGYYYATPFPQEWVYKLLTQKQKEMSG